MAESKPSKFWGDASRKTATWAAVAAIATPLFDHWDEGIEASTTGWKHAAVVVIVAAIRAVIALVQGKVGDPDKASFAPAVSAGDDPAE